MLGEKPFALLVRALMEVRGGRGRMVVFGVAWVAFGWLMRSEVMFETGGGPWGIRWDCLGSLLRSVLSFTLSGYLDGKHLTSLGTMEILLSQEHGHYGTFPALGRTPHS